jgi:hypothetical protein
MSGLLTLPHAAAGQDGFRDKSSEHAGDVGTPLDPAEFLSSGSMIQPSAPSLASPALVRV